jgi:recombination protein RecA
MAKDSNSYLTTFRKELEKIDGVGTSSLPPRYWFSFGNYVLNKIMSNSFTKGVPQGRITSLAGSSGAGKSFLAANLVKAAQDDGAIVLVVDSENALDDDFMSKIGVDVETDEYLYAAVTTVPQVTKVVSSFIKGYKSDWGTAEDAPRVLILIDSLDMLMTETELDHYDKGVQKGDQGQRNKQLKAMLRTFVQDIKPLNITIVFTSQVYKNQDVTNGEGLWIVSDAVKYSASQIALLSKLKLKDKSGGANETIGIRMKAEGYKTRFAKPFQSVTIEVPYDTGMDPLSGLLEAAMGLGVVVQKGSWYRMSDSDELWRAAAIADMKDEILAKCEALGVDTRLDVDESVEIDTSDFDDAGTAASRRKSKAVVDKGEE